MGIRKIFKFKFDDIFNFFQNIAKAKKKKVGDTKKKDEGNFKRNVPKIKLWKSMKSMYSMHINDISCVNVRKNKKFFGLRKK